MAVALADVDALSVCDRVAVGLPDADADRVWLSVALPEEDADLDADGDGLVVNEPLVELDGESVGVSDGLPVADCVAEPVREPLAEALGEDDRLCVIVAESDPCADAEGDGLPDTLALYDKLAVTVTLPLIDTVALGVEDELVDSEAEADAEVEKDAEAEKERDGDGETEGEESSCCRRRPTSGLTDADSTSSAARACCPRRGQCAPPRATPASTAGNNARAAPPAVPRGPAAGSAERIARKASNKAATAAALPQGLILSGANASGRREGFTVPPSRRSWRGSADNAPACPPWCKAVASLLHETAAESG